MTTVDYENLTHFQNHAQDWWDPTGPFRILHDLNPVRMRYLKKTIMQHFGLEQDLSGIRVIDVGCGGGLVCEPLQRLGAQVTGLDAAEENVATAKAHAAQEGLDVHYYATTAGAYFSEHQKQYDVVCALEIIEHVTSPAQFLAECVHLLRPGGILMLSTLNRTFKSILLGKYVAEYLLRWVPAGTHDWQQFLKPAEVARMLEREALDVIDISGLSYAPLSKTWSLGRDADINYFLTATRP